MQLSDGATIPMRLNLDPPDDSKFVRAYVLDQNAVEIGHVNLSLGSDDVFFNNSFIFMSQDSVTVKYKVFDDSSYTTPSNYEEVLDVVTKDTGGSSGSGTGGGQVTPTGFIQESPSLLGMVGTPPVLIGFIPEPNVEGIIESSGEVVGTLPPPSVTGTIEED